MKRTRLFIALLACLTVAFSSCRKDPSVPEKYTVTVGDDGNGTAKATVDGAEASTAEEGATVTLTADAKEGYMLKQWVVSGGGVTLTPDATTSPATFVMPAEAVSIKAEFTALAYAITITDDGNGTAKATVGGAEAATAEEGATVTLTADAKEGYMLKQWVVSGGGVTLTPDATTSPATFVMPAEAVSIKAEFTALAYAITITDDGNGTAKATVDGAEASTAEEGATVTITADAKDGYTFKQWVVSDGVTLTPDAQTNPATFSMPAGAVEIKAEFSEDRVEIDGVTWATCNVDAFGTFAASPESSGMFYQWNRPTAWASTGDVTGWDSSEPSGESWEAANDPCPAGWRLPTKEEQATLLDSEKVSNEWTTLNSVNGCKFTDKTSGKSVFFPAAGSRRYYDGELSAVGDYGCYWSSTHHERWGNNVWTLYINTDGASQSFYSRACGFSVRCVLDR